MNDLSYRMSRLRFHALLHSILFWIVFLVLLFICGVYVRPLFTGATSWLAYGLSGTAASFLAVLVFIKWEKKTFADFGLAADRHTLPRFLAGLGIGTLIFLFIFFCMMAFAGLEASWKGWTPDASIFISLLAIFPLALMEEVAFRSYPFIKLNRAGGLWYAQVIVALVFAVYHVLNGWDVRISFLGPFVWSFVFGLGAARSGGIALPTGIHVALNAMQSLSGMNGQSTALLELRFGSGRENFTGTLVQLVVLIGALAMTYFYTRKQQAAPAPVSS